MADFATAVRADERSAPSDGQFDIPAFLRREANPAAADAAHADAPRADASSEPLPLESGIGRLVYSPAATMRAFESQIVTIAILHGRDDTAGSTSALMPALAWLGGQAPPRAPEAAGGVVAVQLAAPNGAFRIEPQAPLMQVLGSRRNAAEWTFLVTPLKAGKGVLELVIAAGRAVGGEGEATAPETFRIRVESRLNPSQFIRRSGWMVAGGVVIALLASLLTLNALSTSPASTAKSATATPATSP